MKTVILLSIFITILGKFSPKYKLTNSKQLKFQEMINNPKINIIVTTGSAGTGKTLVACQEAIRMLKELQISKIIITRPIVTVEENIGFLPGTLEDKVYPFMIPIYDYFLEHYTKDQVADMLRSGCIEVSPLAFMRGRTFKDCVVIADEMQNTSPNQMKMILTRLGENSKLIITGDLEQTDLGSTNGLQDLIDLLLFKYKDEQYKMFRDGFGHVHLDNSCIKRHPIIEKVLELYTK